MKTTTHVKNYTVTEKLRSILDKKLCKIEKYFEPSTQCTIMFSTIGKTEKMEVTIVAKEQVFRAQATSGSMFSNIDLTLGKIERQIVKNKERLQTVIKREAIDEKRFGFFSKEPKVTLAEVRKQKSFNILSLNADEAGLALETIDHDFYVYANKNDGKVNIMYKRPDGHVGVIEIGNAALATQEN